jgi:hypothetical protein
MELPKGLEVCDFRPLESPEQFLKLLAPPPGLIDGRRRTNTLQCKFRSNGLTNACAVKAVDGRMGVARYTSAEDTGVYPSAVDTCRPSQ